MQEPKTLTALADCIVEGRQGRDLDGWSAPLALSTRPVKSGKSPRTPKYRKNGAGNQAAGLSARVPRYPGRGTPLTTR